MSDLFPESSFSTPGTPSSGGGQKSLWSPLWGHKGKIILLLFTVWTSVEVYQLPFAAVVALRTENPSETEFMRIHANRARAERRSFRKVQFWVPLREVPRDVLNAVIVAEDGTFWRHGGFDWFEVKESFERNIAEGRVARGGSTITQQLVKNLYLSPSKNPLRKLREWALTWYMEETLSKARILEIYLNVIEFGEGMYGIQAASWSYFGKDVSELTRDEAARLASIIPNPRRYRPDEHSRYVQRRTGIILQRMEDRGM